MKSAVRRAVAYLCAVGLLVPHLAGCSPEPVSIEEPGPQSDGVTVVSEDGFEIDIAGLTVTGPPGVAAVGDRVTVTEVGLPDDLAALDLAGSPMIRIQINEGATQPLLPIHVLWEPPGDVDTAMVAFVTRPEASQAWEGLPVKVDGSAVSAELDHLSWAWFVAAGDVFSAFGDGVWRFLGQSFEEPADCLRSVSDDTTSYYLSSEGTQIHGCLELMDGEVHVELTANSPFVWTVQAPGVGRSETHPPPTTSGIVLEAMFPHLFGNRYHALLQPGGSGSFTYIASGVQVNGIAIQGLADAGLGLVPILISGIDMLTTVTGVSLPAEDLVLIGECLASSSGYVTAASAGDTAAAYAGLAQCVVGVMEQGGHQGLGPLSVMLSIIGSLSGQLVTQVRGLLGPITGDTTFRIDVASTPVPQREGANWQLDLAGFGPLELHELVPAELVESFDEAWECFGPMSTLSGSGSVEIWTDDGTVATPIRAIILGDEATTASGIALGAPLEQLQDAYPDLRVPYDAGLQSPSEAAFYSVHDDAGHDGSSSLYFEVLGGEVVGISLQPSIVYWPVSDRVCGGP